MSSGHRVLGMLIIASVVALSFCASSPAHALDASTALTFTEHQTVSVQAGTWGAPINLALRDSSGAAVPPADDGLYLCLVSSSSTGKFSLNGLDVRTDHCLTPWTNGETNKQLYYQDTAHGVATLTATLETASGDVVRKTDVPYDVTTIDSLAPPTPTNLSVTSATTQNASLSWLESSNIAAQMRYNLRMAPSEAALTQNPSSDSVQTYSLLNDTSLDIPNVAVGSWYWQVQAVDGENFTSDWSAIATLQIKVALSALTSESGALTSLQPLPVLVTTASNDELSDRISQSFTGAVELTPPSDKPSATPRPSTQTNGSDTEVKPSIGIIEATGTGWKIFNVMWYWWLVIGTALVIVARRFALRQLWTRAVAS